MPTSDTNPYATPAENSQQTARPNFNHEGRLGNFSFGLALGAPLVAVICAAVGINLGLWDSIGRVVPKPFSLVLYLVISWTGVLLSYLGFAAAMVCIFSGKWWQRAVVVVALILYLLLRPFAISFFVGA